MILAAALLSAVSAQVALGDDTLTDKTLVAWVSPANLEQRGGSVLTIEDAAQNFDAVVFGEIEPGRWMAGSEAFARTPSQQADWPAETAGPDDLVQIAVVYEGKQVTLYRNGRPYAAYTMNCDPKVFYDNSFVLIGRRHFDRVQAAHFQGSVADARIYDRALDAEAIRKLEPDKMGRIKPLAWWSFENGDAMDQMGRFSGTALYGNARVDSGRLHLDDESFLLAGRVLPEARQEKPADQDVLWRDMQAFRDQLLSDPYRPRYHFCPPEGNAYPGDPNGAFYANGRYHLMYLYKVPRSVDPTIDGYAWGHISSKDLVHWRHHPDALFPANGDAGAFSGGGFVDDDGTAYLSYWMVWGARGIGLARSSDRHYDDWQRVAGNPVIRSTEWGITETVDEQGNKLIYGSADPSNIWKKDGKYYMLTGNLLVLNKHGRDADAPADMKGDRLYLFESNDLTDWDYKGVFYERRDGWTDASEDNMCPSFLPLPASANGGNPSGKHLLLFISHNRGCQYYIGAYDKVNDRFTPERHGRMTWVDNTFFAPEALVDGEGRQIMWAWLLDNPSNQPGMGWSGVYGLPRNLWLGEDGTLRMRPVRELEALRHGKQEWKSIKLDADQSRALTGVVGDACELRLDIDLSSKPTRAGVKVRCAPGGEEQTLLYYDAETKELVFDATQSGGDGRRVVERAPLELKDDQVITLRVFVDKSVVEVFANDRQAITRRVYPLRDDSLGVELFSEGDTATFTNVRAWEMMPSNPF